MFVILILLPSIKNIKKSFFVCVAYIILILDPFFTHWYLHLNPIYTLKFVGFLNLAFVFLHMCLLSTSRI